MCSLCGKFSRDTLKKCVTSVHAWIKSYQCIICGKVPGQQKEFKHQKRVLFATNPGLPKRFVIILEE